MCVCGALAAAPLLDVAAVRERCTEVRSAEQVYHAFAAMGLAYGPGHRAVSELAVGPQTAVARLVLPAGIPAEGFVLHPSLMDGALQASLGRGAAKAGVRRCRLRLKQWRCSARARHRCGRWRGRAGRHRARSTSSCVTRAEACGCACAASARASQARRCVRRQSRHQPKLCRR